jgi:hypothetical protein
MPMSSLVPLLWVVVEAFNVGRRSEMLQRVYRGMPEEKLAL